VTLWLWFTVLFANFAESAAEGRAKAQAASLRGARREVMAKKLDEPKHGSNWAKVTGSSLRRGDVVLVEPGDFIPADGEVIEGVGSVDESAITGESAPVIREAGGDFSSVTGGTRLLSDWLVVRVTSNPGETFLDRMISMVEAARRQKTPNEIALAILLAVLTLIFLLATATLLPYSIYGVDAMKAGEPITITTLVALLVCLIPTTIGALLSAIGVAGIGRLIAKNVLAMSGRAAEAAGDVDVLLLDKTGTITLGNRQAAALLPAPGVTERELGDAAQLSSLPDETPEGRSVVVLAKTKFGLRERDVEALHASFVKFSAQTRMSGVDLPDRKIRKGAADAVRKWVTDLGGVFPNEVQTMVDTVAPRRRGGREPGAGARRRGAQGHRERRDQGALRRAPADGHQNDHDHRRQPAHRRGDRRRGRRRRLPARGDARGQAQAHPGSPGGRQARRDDRGRYERRPRPRAGRRGGGHEHRHAGGKGGRQHGRPRLEPDQADRDRRDRQADADDPGRAHDLLDRQRRREVLRDHPGGVRGHLPAARCP
jgi:K+-transporting ATPase ATPase B chain